MRTRTKVYEVPMVMRIRTKDATAAKAEVVKWMDDMTIATDNLPPNFESATISTPKNKGK